MLSNFHLIISFSLSGFGQLLTLYNIKGLTLVVPNIGDQVFRNNSSKDIKNPVSYSKNAIEIQDTRNDKDKALKNLINDQHALIDVDPTPKTGFVDETTKIFIK